VAARNSDISPPILAKSATMVGVSIAIIGIVRLIEARAAEATMIDDVTSAASVAPLAPCCWRTCC
jgi:hypothetical protein